MLCCVMHQTSRLIAKTDSSRLLRRPGLRIILVYRPVEGVLEAKIALGAIIFGQL